MGVIGNIGWDVNGYATLVREVVPWTTDFYWHKEWVTRLPTFLNLIRNHGPLAPLKNRR